jgi:hypothetical protein
VYTVSGFQAWKTHIYSLTTDFCFAQAAAASSNVLANGQTGWWPPQQHGRVLYPADPLTQRVPHPAEPHTQSMPYPADPRSLQAHTSRLLPRVIEASHAAGASPEELRIR